jgi:hypothetical protein
MLTRIKQFYKPSIAGPILLLLCIVLLGVAIAIGVI